MAFADHYLAKQKGFKPYKTYNFTKSTRFIVVIPGINEPFLIHTLDCLNNCQQPKAHVGVIVVVNSLENSSDDIKKQNDLTIQEIDNWKHKEKPFFEVSTIHEPNMPKKFGGAGLARKIGMDEAINQYNIENNPEGVIISLDADAKVAPDYFIEIERFYDQYPDAKGCTLYFEHPLEGNEYDEEIYKSIVLYELYLRYYVQSLRNSGFPFAFHTVGSCFTVKALAYIKQGGMNKKQAGEDFYFLHKIIPLGNFYELNTTCVYPSPRESERVPFGTGPIITKIMQDNFQLLTYHPDVFKEIEQFISKKDEFFGKEKEKNAGILEQVPLTIKNYLMDNNFLGEIDRINKNCSSFGTYQRHFFYWFNAFRVLKFLNYAHEKSYEKISVFEAAKGVSRRLNIKQVEMLNPKELLIAFRAFEKKQGYFV